MAFIFYKNYTLSVRLLDLFCFRLHKNKSYGTCENSVLNVLIHYSINISVIQQLFPM